MQPTNTLHHNLPRLPEANICLYLLSNSDIPNLTGHTSLTLQLAFIKHKAFVQLVLYNSIFYH